MVLEESHITVQKMTCWIENNTSPYIILIQTVSHGVPQDLILGPLLFLLFINDFPNCNSFIKFNIFADGFTLICKFDNHNENFVRQKSEEEVHVLSCFIDAL